MQKLTRSGQYAPSRDILGRPPIPGLCSRQCRLDGHGIRDPILGLADVSPYARLGLDILFGHHGPGVLYDLFHLPRNQGGKYSLSDNQVQNPIHARIEGYAWTRGMTDIIDHVGRGRDGLWYGGWATCQRGAARQSGQG